MITTMGDKATAKMTMIKNNVPVVPGSDGVVKDLEEGQRIADEIGYPVIVKATAGGGGRGMRVIYKRENFKDAFNIYRNEAGDAFVIFVVIIDYFIVCLY